MFLHFPSLQNIFNLRHAVTTRAGGESGGEYSSLNLGYHVGDDAARVTTNRKRLAERLGYDAEKLVAAQQVHGSHSQVVTSEMAGRGALDWQSALPDTDALIVAEAGLPVLILVADCAPLLLVDAERKVLAVVHAGWRGAVAGIASKTVMRLRQEYSSQPEDICVGIGPCLCASCFEVGEEVADEAAKLAPEAVVREYSKPHLDLRLLLRRDLESAGVAAANVDALPRCPKCENETFFSHRAQQGRAGRFSLVVWWE